MSERPPDDPFGGPSSEPAPAYDPAADPFANAPQGATNADGAVLSLVLGIIGIVICPISSPFAWVLGRKAEGLVDASGGTLAGRGMGTAGKILGMIGCVLLVLLIGYVIWVIVELTGA